MKKPTDFESMMRSLYMQTVVYETLTFPLFHFWENTRNYWRTLFRRRMAWVRNWQAIPMIANNKAVWVLTYERRRFLRWVPVQVAMVDTLEECFALMKHRRQAPMQFSVNDEGNVTGATTFSINLKVHTDAAVVRPQGADTRATEADSEVPHGAEASAPEGAGSSCGGSTPEAEAQRGCGEGEPQEVSAGDESVLDRRER